MRDLKRVRIKDTEYPIACTLIVLEKLQEKFNTIEAWEKAVIKSVPSPTELLEGFLLMVNEGIEIFNSETKMDKIEPVTKSCVRELYMTVYELRLLVHDCFMECFERKNAETSMTETDT